MSYQNRVLDTLRLLYDASQGDMSQIAPSYLEALNHEYSDGDVCNLSDFTENIDTFDTFEEFAEHVAPLIKGNGSTGDFSLPLDFAEQGDEAMLKQVIGTVYLEGVKNVSDKNRKRLSEENNYGFDADKGEWSGFFQGDNGQVFSYAINKSGGKWGIEYKLATAAAA